MKMKQQGWRFLALFDYFGHSNEKSENLIERLTEKKNCFGLFLGLLTTFSSSKLQANCNKIITQWQMILQDHLAAGSSNINFLVRRVCKCSFSWAQTTSRQQFECCCTHHLVNGWVVIMKRRMMPHSSTQQHMLTTTHLPNGKTATELFHSL